MSAKPLLEVEKLAAGYPMLPVLFDISLSVFPGEIVTVLGSNGVGKSTLINNIAGLYRPTGGRIVFDGEEIARAGSERIVERGLVQVPEGRRIFPNLTVHENLVLGSYRRGGARCNANVERVIAYFPRLSERMKQHAGTLSGGEQQMLAIGRGLMSEPRMLMLDEPSLGLSPIMVAEIFALFRRLKADGLTMLLVEQNLVQSLEIADRGYVIEHGEVALSGRANEILANDGVRRAYLGL
jgi:branched-chain amino acid transport system ATP-binding protein